MRLRRLVSWLVLIALVAVWLWSKAPEASAIIAANGQPVHVIDGDSLRIGDTEIRIAGIDAPEYRQNCMTADGGPWPCGKEARETLVALAAKPGLACTTRAKDRYGRSLADCRTDAGDIAEALARAGLALDAGDERFDSHAAGIAAAKAAHRGVWQGAHQHPSDWRKANTPRAIGD